MAVPSAAQAQHELHGHMSAAGVEYLETAIPTALPEQLSFDNASRDLLECTDTRTISMTVNDTVVSLSINDLNIQMPENGVMRIDANVSASGDGELYLENPYACFGEGFELAAGNLKTVALADDGQPVIIDGASVSKDLFGA